MDRPLKALLDPNKLPLQTMAQTAYLKDVVKLMLEKQIGAVLVVDGKDLVGMVSERTLLATVAKYPSIENLTLKEVMLPRDQIVVLSPDATISEAMKWMTERRCRHIPIMQAQKLLGIISIGDITKSLLNEQSHEIDQLVHYISG